MDAVFMEMPAFARHRGDYLDDDVFQELQCNLLGDPEAGDLIVGAGGLRKLRKLRFADRRRSQGKRGGLRVIYFWWSRGRQFWLFTIYDKSEAADLTAKQRSILRDYLKRELETRER